MKLKTLHKYLSLFFFPIFLLFNITGLFTMFGYKPTPTVTKITIPEPQGGNTAIANAVFKALEEKQLPLPNSREIYLKKGVERLGKGHISVVLKYENGNLIISHEENGVFATIMSLHKGNSLWYFKVFSLLFVLSIGVTYITGIIFTIRSSTFMTSAMAMLSGLTATLALIILSM